MRELLAFWNHVKSLRLLQAAAAIACAGAAVQAQPANDSCGGATTVVVGANPVSNIGANFDDGRDCPLGTSFASVFYRFTAPSSGIYSASTCGGVLWNSRLAVYPDCVGGPLACNGNDPNCGNASTVTWGATAGTTYIIRLSGESQTAQGNGTMNITLAGPANDACANATPMNLTGALNPLTGSNIGATTDGSSSCGGGRDVWYSFSPMSNFTLELSMCDGDFAPVLSVHTGNCGALTQLACSTSSTLGRCPTQGRPFIRVPVSMGNTYLIRVAGLNDAQGNFNLFALLGAPINDNCADAMPISVGQTVGGTTNGSTTDGAGSCANGGGGADVWYTIAGGGAVQFEVCATNFTPMVTIFTGGCAPSQEIACNQNTPIGSCDGGGAVATACLDGQGPYLVRVGGFTSSNFGDFTLTATPAAQVSQEVLCNAGIAVTDGTTTFSTVGGCADGIAGCGQSAAAPAKWFVYTATCNGPVTIDTCGSSFDTVLNVYTGTCDALTEIACNDDSFTCPQTFRASQVTFDVAAGTTYRIRASGFNGAAGNVVMNIRSAAPTNNVCSNASAILAGTTGFDTTCAVPDGIGAPCVFNAAKALWYTYTANCTGTVNVNTCPTQFDTGLSAYSGSCDGLSIVACNDDAFSCPTNTLASEINFPVVSGETYFIRVSGFNGSAGAGEFTVTCTPQCPWQADGCYADHNNDDSIDGDDVISFFADWDASSPCADADQSEGVDGDDVIAFFTLWDSSGAGNSGC